MNDLLYKELTSRIIHCFYTAYNTLGFGFLEKVYENYLKATDKEIGLLLNFGKKPEFRRKIFTNDKKQGNTSSLLNDETTE